jgi:hypothetical protein
MPKKDPMKTVYLRSASIVIILYSLFSCSSAKVNSNPRNLYFSQQDTIIISGLKNSPSMFIDFANQQMESAFQECDVKKVLGTYAYQDVLIRKAGIQDLNISTQESMEQLSRLGLTGYIIDAEILSANNENSLVTFTPKEATSQVVPDPWIKFQFTIYHINTKSKALTAEIRVQNSSIIVGENVDENIGINKGLNNKNPTAEFNKALRKLRKVCHCK